MDEELSQSDMVDLQLMLLDMKKQSRQLDRIGSRLRTLQGEKQRSNALELQLEAERRQKREDRRKEAERMMSRSTKSYSTKARFDTNVIEDCYALKKRLPLSSRKRFQDEYNATMYGEEQQLIDKYRRLYRL